MTDIIVWASYALLFFLFYLATPFGGVGRHD